MTMLAAGQTAPDFNLPSDKGGSFRLSEHRGHPVVVEFYCEDDSEGCAVENKEFSDLLPQFDKLGIPVVSISPQSVDSHKRFAGRHGFRQPLLADTGLKANNDYGVWQLKKLWGREYMGTIRVTFLVDAKGKIAEVIKASRIKGHAQRVLEAATALAAGTR